MLSDCPGTTFNAVMKWGRWPFLKPRNYSADGTIAITHELSESSVCHKRPLQLGTAIIPVSASRQVVDFCLCPL